MSPYNGIIGRPGLKAIQAVPSTVHGMLKFPVEGGIATNCSTILIPTECASVTTSSVIPREERAYDLVVKSYTEVEMMRDIKETFRTLRKVNMKLNPKKCSFGLAEGVFLGPDDRTGNNLNADLLYKSRVTGSETKLLADGEIGLVTSLRSKKTLTVFSGTSYHEGVEFTYALRFQFTASNNEALVADLRIAEQMRVKNVQVNVDSKLVANQVFGTYVAKEDNMIKYMEIVKGLVSGFTTFSISQVPRSKNKKADALSKIASTSFAHLSKQVLVEVLENKYIKEKEVAAVIEEDGPTWMTQRSFLTSWLRCVGPLQADYVMREIHEGSCSMHAGPRSVVAKAVWLGYYWSTMHKDARDMIRKCNDCQIHRPIKRHPQQSLTPIMAPWPFYKWGIDIACPFPEGPGKVKFLIVTMDYFTKWIEAKAVATITGGQVKKFVWDNIVCRFVIPTEIGMPTYRTAVVDVVNNNEELRLNLDLLEERRERAAICEARAKSKMMKYYNARVRGVSFKPSDFVYRSNDASHAIAGGKLRPK
nr:reverse transcriptase domain-containing protein [Tanacetum cinerariifolium]